MKRIFSIGNITDIPDPAPKGSLEQAFESLVARFPAIRHSRIFESDAVPVDAQTVRYTIPLVPAKVNG